MNLVYVRSVGRARNRLDDLAADRSRSACKGKHRKCEFRGRTETSQPERVDEQQSIEPLAVVHGDRSDVHRAMGTTQTVTQSWTNVLVVVEDVVGVVRGLHVHQPVVGRVAVRLADPVGVFVAAEEVDVDALAEAAQGSEKPCAY